MNFEIGEESVAIFGEGVAQQAAVEVAWGQAVVDGRVVANVIDGVQFLVMERA